MRSTPGEPDERVRAGLSPVDGSDIPRRMVPRLIGFLRQHVVAG